MDLQTTKQINIDVAKYKYIKINAKQYDRNLRYILITCYRNDELLPINRNTHFASIRYRKPDGNGVFNGCEITSDGRILVELTEQMLAVAGFCYADVVVHENVELAIDIVENDDGSVEIIDTGNSGIISTMTFAVDVHEAAFDNEEVESSYEYNKLNDLIAKAENTYEIVMTSCNNSKNTAQSYAVGGTGTRTDEDTDNAKYYYEESSQNAKSADESEAKALEYRNLSQSYAIGGISVRDGEDEDNAKWYYEQSLENAKSADKSEAKALEYRNLAQSYAIGGTGIEERPDEATDNAKWYYEQSSENAKSADNSKEVVEQINNNIIGSINTLASNGNIGSFIFMGDITFEELTLLADDEKAMGFVYKIIDDFITDDTFEGTIGLSYTAGTSVYYTSNNKWNCLGGAVSPVATADEVMEYLNI